MHSRISLILKYPEEGLVGMGRRLWNLFQFPMWAVRTVFPENFLKLSFSKVFYFQLEMWGFTIECFPPNTRRFNGIFTQIYRQHVIKRWINKYLKLYNPSRFNFQLKIHGLGRTLCILVSPGTRLCNINTPSI